MSPVSRPGTSQWVAWCSLTALVTAVLLVLARLLRLGFLGDFLSASVLIGFLTGVGVQVLTGQLPDMLGIPAGSGNWLEQQWHVLTSLGEVNPWTLGFALGTLAIIVGFRRWAPRVPGALVAVVLFIVVSQAADAAAHGVAVVGEVTGGFPPVGLPADVTFADARLVLPTATVCLILVIAQSAATARSFAMRAGDRVDVNRDIVGLAAANAAAGVTGTFVVNGSPTKTEILDEEGGHSQVANITMALVTLLVTMFATGLLAPMPKAVLGAIVFLIGYGLVDVVGPRHDPRPGAARVRHRARHGRGRLRRRRRAGHRAGDRALDPAAGAPAVPAERLRGRCRRRGTADVPRRRPGPAEHARAHRVPLRRGAVLRQRQPVRRRRPVASSRGRPTR